MLILYLSLKQNYVVIIAKRIHLFPYRTQKLSSLAAMVLGGQPPGRVAHPYSLVKDNRSGYESNNPKAVLDGDLDGFIYAYLKSAL